MPGPIDPGPPEELAEGDEPGLTPEPTPAGPDADVAAVDADLPPPGDEPSADDDRAEDAAETDPDPSVSDEPDVGAFADATAATAVAEDVADPTLDADRDTTLWSSPGVEPATSLPWLQARSPDERICPFLRAVADDDGLGFPVESPDAANRCAAMHDAVPQSLRQQELVCLTPSHVNCPRYLRGAAATSEPVTAAVRPKAILTPAISAALVILALSFAASVVFGLANGGLAMPSKAAATGPAASASRSRPGHPRRTPRRPPRPRASRRARPRHPGRPPPRAASHRGARPHRRPSRRARRARHPRQRHRGHRCRSARPGPRHGTSC